MLNLSFDNLIVITLLRSKYEYKIEINFFLIANMLILDMKKFFSIKATGKNIELGSFFQKYNLKKLSSVFLKYSANPISANTVLEKRNVFFKVKLDILIDNNIKFETLGRSKIATLALDEAVENISKRLRRHYRKLKNHRLLNNRIVNVKKDLVRFHLNS